MPRTLPTAASGLQQLERGCRVAVVYQDHVCYNRGNPEVIAPQTRECIGWLVYESPEYIVVSWDRDAGPPTLKGGDPKASGLVLLRSAILELRRLP